MSTNLFHTISLSLLLLNVFQENHLKNVCQQKFFAKNAKNYACEKLVQHGLLDKSNISLRLVKEINSSQNKNPLILYKRFY